MPTRSRAKTRTSGGKAVAKRKTRSRAETSPATRSRRPKAPDQSTEKDTLGLVIGDEGLTGAQLIFVEAICADPTRPAVDAARKAYPDQKPETHYSTAYENLRKPEIRKAIGRRMNPLMAQSRTSREAITRVVGEGIHWDPADILNDDGTVKPVREWPIECRRQLAGIDVDEIKVGPVVIGVTKSVKFIKRSEFVTLGARMNKMLTDKVEHTGSLLEDLIAAAPRKAAS